MSVDARDLETLFDSVEDHLAKARAQLGELRRMVAQIDLPDARKERCPDCRIVLPGPRALARHLYQVHGKGSPPDSDLERTLLEQDE